LARVRAAASGRLPVHGEKHARSSQTLIPLFGLVGSTDVDVDAFSVGVRWNIR
jgi:hypothetical protein